MNPNEQEPTLEDSIKQVMQILPPVIRDYLAQGKYTAVVQSLSARYGLRLDQVGVIEREVMLLLMGIESPDEFMQALAEDAKLDRQTIESIARDVNEMIFVPLRAQEEQAAEEAPSQGAGAPAQPARSGQGSPLPPKVVMPQVVRTTGSLGDAVRLALTKPEGSLMLEDREEPHMEFSAPPAAQPSQGTVAQSAPAAPRQAVKRTPLPRAGVRVVAYTTDPYREPIDDGK